MAQAATPNLPKTGDSPGQRQLLAGLDEFIRALLRRNVFQARDVIEPAIQTRDGDTSVKPLKWGVLNRVHGPYNAILSLPPIRPEWVGVPLRVIKQEVGPPSNLLVYPQGYALDLKTRSLINGGATKSLVDVRLYTFETDGVHWFVDLG